MDRIRRASGGWGRVGRAVSLCALSLTLLAGSSATGDVGFEDNFQPHVIVGLRDTGINPYHELFYRPELTEHPCTYIQDFPCSVQELPLSVGVENWNDAMQADAETWASVDHDAWYWIPRTVFVAVRCGLASDDLGNPAPRQGPCIIDDPDGFAGPHGTWTTSVITMQNPDALIAFNQFGDPSDAHAMPFLEGSIPVDVVSVSDGSSVPLARRPGHDLDTVTVNDFCNEIVYWPIFVISAGNTSYPSFSDCEKGDPATIVVGGGASDPRSHAQGSGNAVDVESYDCHPVAAWGSTRAIHPPGARTCGTSLAAPTVAAALSKVILELRRTSGYLGTLTEDGYIDPLLEITVPDLRASMNSTATYEPAPRFRAPGVWVPLYEDAPWLQWGWGFYDADIAQATIDDLLGIAPAPAKPQAAHDYMTLIMDLRRTLHG